MQHTWNGNDGSYTDASNWTPQGVPLYGGGASAVIQSGTVTLSNAEPNDIPIALAGPSEDSQPDLVLDNAALGPGVVLTLVSFANSAPGQAPAVGFATVTVAGYDTSAARVFLEAPRPTRTSSTSRSRPTASSTRKERSPSSIRPSCGWAAPARPPRH